MRGDERDCWDHTVGGHTRMPMERTAPLVDRAVGEQFTRLAARLAASRASIGAGYFDAGGVLL